jgi:hypothetical protein
MTAPRRRWSFSLMQILRGTAIVCLGLLALPFVLVLAVWFGPEIILAQVLMWSDRILGRRKAPVADSPATQADRPE